MKREQSANVEKGQCPRPASPTCTNGDVEYASNLLFNASKDYTEDRDNDLEQSDDAMSSSPYRDAIIHNNDVESSYYVVTPRSHNI